MGGLVELPARFRAQGGGTEPPKFLDSGLRRGWGGRGRVRHRSVREPQPPNEVLS